MEIIKNNKGGSKLCVEGYLYTKKSSNSTRIHWECSQRNAFSCKGCALTDLEVKQLLSVTEHSHDPDPNKVKAAKVKNTIKTVALTNRVRPAHIVADAICQQPIEVRCAIGRLDSLKRNVRRLQKGALPKDPTSLRELEHISGEWKTTGAPEYQDFLIYDNGPESTERIIVFATNQALEHLARSTIWFMDGTFATAPRLFQQLYIIRVPLGLSAVTCVYAFLSAKSQSAYEELLRAILDKCDYLGFNPDPTNVMTDFERAMINAISTVLGPHVSSRGCFYHLTQSTWRKVQSLGLTTAYRSDDRVKHFCGMLDGLAFLPIDEVANGMDYLMENIPDVEGLEGLVDYFSSTYVFGTCRSIQPPAFPDGIIPPVCMRRIPPLFPPQLWNVHQATIDDEDRTNNLCESWNFAFHELVGHDHPTIWKAIESIRKDQALVATALIKDSRGEPPRKRVKRATKEHQQRLKNLCLDYVNERKTLEEFLNGVGHSIRW